MYFINYNPLKEKLRNRELSDKEVLPYQLLTSLMYTIVGGSVFYGKIDPNGWDSIQLIIEIIVVLLGVTYVYRCNQGADGYDLVQKFLVLGWIGAFRFLLVFIPLFLVVVYPWLLLLGLDSGGTSLIDVIFGQGFKLFIIGDWGGTLKTPPNKKTR